MDRAILVLVRDVIARLLYGICERKGSSEYQEGGEGCDVVFRYPILSAPQNPPQRSLECLQSCFLGHGVDLHRCGSLFQILCQ